MDCRAADTPHSIPPPTSGCRDYDADLLFRYEGRRSDARQDRPRIRNHRRRDRAQQGARPSTSPRSADHRSLAFDCRDRRVGRSGSSRSGPSWYVSEASKISALDALVPPICTSRCRARQARSGVSDPKAALESYTCRILGFPRLFMRVRPRPTKLGKWVLDQAAHSGTVAVGSWRGVIARPAAHQRRCRLANSTKLMAADDNARSAGTPCTRAGSAPGTPPHP